jgi:hypothetical protein
VIAWTAMLACCRRSTPECALAVSGAAGQAPSAGAASDCFVEAVFAYVYAQLPNQADAELLTERVLAHATDDLPPARWSRRGVLRRLFGLADAALPADRPVQSAPLPRALAKLSPEERQVLVLRFGQHLEVAAIAELLALDEHTVRRLQLRALRSLRRLADS